MADVNLSYNEYQALLDKIKALENEKSEHIKLIDDKVGMIVIQRSVRGTLDQYAFNNLISNYFINKSRQQLGYLDQFALSEEFVKALKDLEAKQEYVAISDIGKEIETLSESLEEAILENTVLKLKNKELTDDNNELKSYYMNKIDELNASISYYKAIETEYRKVEHYLSEIDTMIAHQKNLEEELDKLKSVILFVSNKVRYSIWGVGKAIKNFLNKN